MILLRFRDINNGEGVRVYRSTEEIRLDIERVSRGVNEIYSMLNIRNLLVDMLVEYSEQSPERWIGALGELISEAEALLVRARRLEETLAELARELDEAKCAMMM